MSTFATKLAATAAIALLPTTAAAGPATAQPRHTPTCESHWIGSWMAAPSDWISVTDASAVPNLFVAQQTYRLVITPHHGGSTARVHLTNRARPLPMEVGHVTIGLQADGADVAPGSLRDVTFGGSRAVTIPAGGDVVSDPVDLSFNGFQPLAVGVYLPGPAPLPTQHFNGNTTSFYSPPFSGDRTADLSGSALTMTTTSMPLVSGLDTMAPGDTSTIVALGDSITDGYAGANLLGLPQDRSVVDRNARYPDFLQRRLDAAGLPFSVLNAGISGNRITRHGAIPQYGPSALDRVQRDVVDKPGVSDVIVLEGINDLGIPVGVSYDELVDGYTALIDRLHSAGLRVHLGTITPTSNALLDGVLTFPPAEPVRQRVNEWIRGQHLSDSVIDFDAALRDPGNPSNLNPRYAGPDNLHPNTAGYQEMAQTIDLNIFRRNC
ncbi:GDSL-type esterase/lipase family protein [Nocardia sp. NPDC058518]|uniref:GDSL-type esterase/lipase family protein n=1 Tax=Nocardia sp. NPDC058518 TaxID=3346534 RepID=UPI003653B056